MLPWDFFFALCTTLISLCFLFSFVLFVLLHYVVCSCCEQTTLIRVGSGFSEKGGGEGGEYT